MGAGRGSVPSSGSSVSLVRCQGCRDGLLGRPPVVAVPMGAASWRSRRQSGRDVHSRSASSADIASCNRPSRFAVGSQVARAARRRRDAESVKPSAGRSSSRVAYDRSADATSVESRRLVLMVARRGINLTRPSRRVSSRSTASSIGLMRPPYHPRWPRTVMRLTHHAGFPSAQTGCPLLDEPDQYGQCTGTTCHMRSVRTTPSAVSRGLAKLCLALCLGPFSHAELRCSYARARQLREETEPRPACVRTPGTTGARRPVH